MSLHLPSALALVVSAAFQPRLLVPHLTIRDLRQLDFVAMRKFGYSGAVFDKDNCLTLPLKDNLIPQLTEHWRSCKDAFGPSRVLVVSNSAGTVDDPGAIQAESVSHALGVPVLIHLAKKPGWPCVRDVRREFAKSAEHLADEQKLAVIGDRLLTDVVLAHRLAKNKVSWSLSRATPQTKFKALAIFVEPWHPADARAVRSVENSWLQLARKLTGLREVPLVVDGSEVVGVRVMDGWQDEVRPFVGSWQTNWDKTPRKVAPPVGPAEWEGY
ncbi:HAD phosphatase [Auriculariales sp. MPI-PUGE-AT-0066]|nr:HAD phosphatase [Auriculariales sp. MPI-PUGE-AT-0066]